MQIFNSSNMVLCHYVKLTSCFCSQNLLMALFLFRFLFVAKKEKSCWLRNHTSFLPFLNNLIIGKEEFRDTHLLNLRPARPRYIKKERKLYLHERLQNGCCYTKTSVFIQINISRKLSIGISFPRTSWRNIICSSLNGFLCCPSWRQCWRTGQLRWN